MKENPAISVICVTWIVATLLRAEPAAAKELQCEVEVVSVDLPELAPRPLELTGDLCWYGSQAPARVHVLLHGAGFDRRYWHASDLQRSYVRALTVAGWTVFNLDRLGSGDSAHPAGAGVGVDVQVDALHQVIGQLRTGVIASRRFDRVVTVGHSLGAIIAMLEAGLHRDVDGLILTGFSHALSPEARQRFAASLQPANTELAFADRDENYFTTRPGTRAAMFLDGAIAPGVVDRDEMTKGVVTMGELGPSNLGDLSAAVTAPVLIVAGALDPFACPADACPTARALEVLERQAFVASPQVAVVVLPATGHALEYHRTAPLAWIAAASWALSVRE
jgi:pimeloyl-ACP methyl ester carboxylesterase